MSYDEKFARLRQKVIDELTEENERIRRLLLEATMLLYDWDVTTFGRGGSIVEETKAFIAKVGYDPVAAALADVATNSAGAVKK